MEPITLDEGVVALAQRVVRCTLLLWSLVTLGEGF